MPVRCGLVPALAKPEGKPPQQVRGPLSLLLLSVDSSPPVGTAIGDPCQGPSSIQYHDYPPTFFSASSTVATSSVTMARRPCFPHKPKGKAKHLAAFDSLYEITQGRANINLELADVRCLRLTFRFFVARVSPCGGCWHASTAVAEGFDTAWFFSPTLPGSRVPRHLRSEW